jgi:hypothetical protein
VLDPEQLPGWFVGVKFADDVSFTDDEEGEIELLAPPIPGLDLPPPARREEDDEGEGEGEGED